MDSLLARDETGTPYTAAELLPTPTGPLRIAAQAEVAVRPIRLSLVIPTFNEANSMRELVCRLVACLEVPLGGAYELIVVDDDSPDMTWETAQSLTAEYPKLRVMRRRNERGLSTAVIRGWQAARGEVLAVIDGDLQHPPEVVVSLWKAMERGVDLGVGSRHVRGGGVSDWAVYRRILSRGAQLLGLLILPRVVGRVSDPMSGYFMVRRSAIADKTLNPVGYKILIEVLGRGNIGGITEVGYRFRERFEGASKVTWRVYLEYLAHLGRLRLDGLPLGRFARFCAVGLSGVLVDMGLLYLLSDPRTLGWGLTRSKILAAECAIVGNFLLNDVWTFGDATLDEIGPARKLRRFIKFNVICTLGLMLNVVLLNLQFNQLHIDRYAANAVAIAVVTLWNFWLNTRFSWRTSAIP